MYMEINNIITGYYINIYVDPYIHRLWLAIVHGIVYIDGYNIIDVNDIWR